LLQQGDRLARWVADGGALGINAQVPVERCLKIPNADAALRGMLAEPIGGADHLALSNARAAEQE
jgi:hypothetical protein